MRVWMISTFVALVVGTGHCWAKDEIVIMPAEFTLTGPESRQRLLVETVLDGQPTGPVTEEVVFSSSDENVVRIEDETAIPTGDGTATVTVSVGEQSATAMITVEKFNQPFTWSFRNHVQSVLSKASCNSGACHGAAAGKNGFKLSLRGYDAEADYWMITRQSRGRRIVPSDPGRSLLLTKPTGVVPHKGGLRIDTDSREYRVIADWLADGHPAPSDDDPRIDHLEILPKNVVLTPESSQQLVVRAHFTDGHTEDVTKWAKYTANNLSVAKVNQNGRVDVMGTGEGAIVAWYLSQNVVATVTVPQSQKLGVSEKPGFSTPGFWKQQPRNNFIDDLVLEKLERLNIPPSPLASDSEFVRRVYLDTIGTLPTVAEVNRFLGDTAPDKRYRLVDELLARPEFVDYWTYQWSDLLLVSGQRLRPAAVDAYYNWIKSQVEANVPWDEFCRQIVTARGSTFENGAANFYSLHQDPLDMAETISMAFLGMSIQCARCHDHPLEKWTNDQYYGMANLFARVRGKGWGGDFRSGDGLRTIFLASEGEVIQPRTGQPQSPRPLDAEPIPFDTARDRRDYLADWLVVEENPYFSRAIVNRVWANYLGVGIVEAVDDMRLTNPPSNPELLDALAEFLIENDYNLKKLMRLILTSTTYQRTSNTVEGNQSDKRFYSRYYPKRLSAEVMLDAISQVTDVPTAFSQTAAPGGTITKIEVRPGTRAIQLADTSVVSYFLQTFGRPERLITCECERSDEPSMKQVLHIMNGATLGEKLAAPKNRIDQLMSQGKSNEEIVDFAYISALARSPTSEEKSRILAVISEADDADRRLVIEDLYWSLLSSNEFLFNR